MKNEPLRVAVTDPYDELALEKIRFKTSCRIVPEVHTEAEIRQMERARHLKGAKSILQELSAPDTTREKAHSWESEPIVNLVDSLLDTALEQNATDIHLEPTAKGFRIRFRIDGMLQQYKTLPAWLAEPVLIRLKILANADITERRLPHDGSFTFQGARETVNVRLSTIPVTSGEQPVEKCVLRLLSTNDDGATLDSLELSDALLSALRKSFEAPQGLLLVTGPTGSGKTTTLYAGLREIIAKKINVTTIEDPVEYKLEGANQVQVNEKCGFTFAVALRSILRQDPDVILVGEIRDSETAQIALRAAQTGHLVLATLHTNNAKAAQTRLQDLGIPPALLRDSLLGVVAQRLLRKGSREQGYRGRIATMEFLTANGSYASGNMLEYARQLVQQCITDKAEVERVLGAAI